MSTSILGGTQPQANEFYPSLLLKFLLYQMMAQFEADGACIALYDERNAHMEMRCHVCFRHERPNRKCEGVNAVYEVAPQESDLFPVGATYAPGQDLVGFCWRQNEPYILRQDEYLRTFHPGQPVPGRRAAVPSMYLVTPVKEPTWIDEARGIQAQPRSLGIVVLYQTTLRPSFQQKQLSEALGFAERIALYLQNDQLRRAHQRTSDYMQRLQDISAAFPSTVKLQALVENAHQFAANLVDASSMLITLYDRDSNKIYDVYAFSNGSKVEGLPAPPVSPEERSVWCNITSQEKRSLLLSPVSEHLGEYDELLAGVWGDQRKAGTFLFLPMKMYKRVIGSLSLASAHANAYHPEEIQVLETMAQIITVGIENVRLYERLRLSLQAAQQRENQLAGLNSILQTITSVLDEDELLHNLVESIARLVQSDISVFFQLSNDKDKLIARAIFVPPGSNKARGAAEPPSRSAARNHAHLIEMIRLPLKDSILENLVNEGFFYLDQSQIETLAQSSEEGGVIFLRETNIQQMLMIPMRYQRELVGILAVDTPRQHHFFRPNQVGMLLAICAQVAGAIRNAQLFEEIQEAYAEQQRLDKLKDEFLVTASHELRTPLSAISGYTTMLKRQSNRANPQPEHIQRYTAKISSAAQQLMYLVDSMTEAAKIGTLDKKLDLQFQPVRLASAVDIAITMLSVNIEQKIIPRVDAALWVTGDPLRVRQIITNLLDNAAKYSPPHTHIEIIAAAMRLSQVPLPDDQLDSEKDRDLRIVLINVYDQGDGIVPEEHERVFEKFYRASRSLTTTIRGSGLGLYICRRYIEAMGGKLWLANSVPGQGSTFSFYLQQIDAPTEASEGDEGNAADEQLESQSA